MLYVNILLDDIVQSEIFIRLDNKNATPITEERKLRWLYRKQTYIQQKQGEGDKDTPSYV